MREIILTNHAIFQLGERKISIYSVKEVARYGQVIRTGPHGIIIKIGLAENGRMLKVVLRIKGQRLIVITTYYANIKR